MKTATLVPQVAKGIGQGIKDKNYGVLGQLALNMGTNGAKIVIYAKDIKKEINEILKDATVVDGVLSLNMENTEEINNLLKDVLSEFGKSFYDINYIVDGNLNQLMAVNDSDGRLAINLAGIGFGNVDNLLTGVVHEGGHGTYANAAIDEKAVGALTGKIVYEQNKGIVLSDELAAKVFQDTVQYFNDRADGKLMDWYDEKTHKQYRNKNPNVEEVKALAEKTGKTEEEIKENYGKHYYYWAMENLNTKFENKAEFDKIQEELATEINKLDIEIRLLQREMPVGKEKSEMYGEISELKLKKSLLEDKIYTKTLDAASLYHNLVLGTDGIIYIDLTFPNMKYENKLGQEAVFDKNGRWVTGMNSATYNIGGLKGSNSLKGFYYHNFNNDGDVEMWIKYGTGPNDKLTVEQRKEISKIGFNKTVDPFFNSWRIATGKNLISIQEYNEYKKFRIELSETTKNANNSPNINVF